MDPIIVTQRGISIAMDPSDPERDIRPGFCGELV